MRLSNQLCFLVAAAIASAVNGAPIGDKLERRQAITLELTPTQKVDVDGSREVPTILISDNGRMLGQQQQQGGYAINMPPVSTMQELMTPQTSYDPYAENYAPYSSYPPSRGSLMSQSTPFAAPPVQSQAISAVGPPQVAAAVPPVPSWTNAGWNAPLIPSGNFADSLHGTPTAPLEVTPTSTTSAPVPVPGGSPQIPAPPSNAIPIEQQQPPAPLPISAPATGPTAAKPTSLASIDNKSAPSADNAAAADPVPASTTTTTPQPPAPEVQDNKKPAEIKTDPLPPPRNAPTGPEIKALANEAAAASSREQTETKPVPPPPQRRSLRSGTPKKDNLISFKRRENGVRRLRKRQLELEGEQLPPSSLECEPSKVEKVEILVPVTEAEMAALQEGTVELVSYPSTGPDGSQEKLYDVLPVTMPTKLDPTLKEIYEQGAQKMAASASSAEDFTTQQDKSQQDEAEQLPRPRSLNAGEEETPEFRSLDKRLKYGSNGFNSSMVGNGAGKTKYGFVIHDNTNGSSSTTPIAIYSSMALAAIVGVWAAIM